MAYEGPIRKGKQGKNRVHHLELGGYDNVPRIEACPVRTIAQWWRRAEFDVIG